MNRFGTIKTKALEKISEAYINGKKDEIKNILMLIKEDKNFVDLYLFYEEIENKYIEDKGDAELFIEGIIPILKDKKVKTNKFCKELDKKIGDVSITENSIYLFLDKISENDTLKNAYTKINAKKKLVEHLMTKKESLELQETTFSKNENLLHAVLANNFNVLYNNTLNENEKKQLTEILSISEKDLKTNFSVLQEEVNAKVDKMISEEKNDELKIRLVNVIAEARVLKPTKLNYYKLQQLKNGL
jgi:hypothetical protein